MNDTIHDCYVNVYGKKPSGMELMDIITRLPDDIILLAAQWGPNDTEFRERVFVWLKEQKELVLCAS